MNECPPSASIVASQHSLSPPNRLQPLSAFPPHPVQLSPFMRGTTYITGIIIHASKTCGGNLISADPQGPASGVPRAI